VAGGAIHPGRQAEAEAAGASAALDAGCSSGSGGRRSCSPGAWRQRCWLCGHREWQGGCGTVNPAASTSLPAAVPLCRRAPACLQSLPDVGRQPAEQCSCMPPSISSPGRGRGGTGRCMLREACTHAHACVCMQARSPPCATRGLSWAQGGPKHIRAFVSAPAAYGRADSAWSAAAWWQQAQPGLSPAGSDGCCPLQPRVTCPGARLRAAWQGLHDCLHCMTCR